MPDGGCRCAKIELADWKDREVTLAGHAFLSRWTPLFLHVPHRFYRDLEALWSEIEGGRYKLAGPPLVLHHDAWFSGEVLVSTDAPPGTSLAIRTFETLFYSRVVKSLGFDAALREM